MAFLGASWRSWANSGLKLAPEMVPKLVQIWSKKWSKTCPIFGFVFGPVFTDFENPGGRPAVARPSTLFEEVPRAASRAVLLTN